MSDPARIVNVRQETQLQMFGPAKNETVVTYFLGTDGPFYKRYDTATFDVDAVRRELDQHSRDHARLKA